ncbi:MAG: DUF2244 domain-containing protein [Rhodobacteraceae bacterium]|nr:DUF2244 domain-containing protein [Paracoccaceae bacterium]
MPYEWNASSDPAGATRHLRLWPHRSLPRRGFAMFILITCAMLTLPLYPLLGTVTLWGLLPFLMLAVGGVWFALEKSYSDAAMGEELTIDSEQVHLRRVNPRGRGEQEWDCQSYWAQVHMHPTGGPVPHYVTLRGHGREVEIGAFLSEDERKALYGEIADALKTAAAPVADQPPAPH